MSSASTAPPPPTATPEPAIAVAASEQTAKPRWTPAFLRENWAFLKQFSIYLWPYRGRFILGQLAGIVFASLNGALPLLLKTVLAYALPETGPASASSATPRLPAIFTSLPLDATWTILLACMAIPSVMILRSFFDYLNTYCMAWLSLRILSDLRRKLFAHITSQSLDFFHQQRAGLLISRVANDTRVAQGALELIGADLVKQPVTIIAGISTLLYLDARFTLIALVLFPTCIIPVAIYGKRVRKASRREEEQSGEMTVILQETFAGIRVIKSFAREGFQTQLFDRLSAAQFSNSMRARKAAEIVGPLVEVVAAIGAALALFYVHASGLSLARFVALIMGMFLLYNPAKQISKLHLQISRFRAATASLFALLELRPQIVDAPDAIALTGRSRGAVVFSNVNFSYHGPGGPPALAGIDLAIQPGRYHALVGASGAGKSTFFALVQRFYDPDSGLITLDGVDLRRLSQASLREQIGIVSQDTFLFHDTVANNIRYGRLDASDEEVRAAAALAHADEFIRALTQGYDTIVGDKGCRLSGGQQQRLAIARAILKDAPILLLDEATSALDSESERAVQEAMERLATGRTVIAIAHRLSTILAADEIIVLEAGRIIERGRHNQLLANENGIYRRLYDLQFGRAAAPAGDASNAAES